MESSSTNPYITEENAVNLCGVTSATLNRFVEVGYLNTVSEENGKRLFSANELSDLFGIDEGALEKITSSLDEKVEKISENIFDTSKDDKIDFSSSDNTDTDYIESESNSDQIRHNSDKLNSISFKKLLSLQEKILEMRELEIKDLKQQRDWLQSRVEKLEAQSDRDRVILLSQTHAVRRLIGLQEKKKSAVRATLEFFGFVQPEKQVDQGMADLLPAEIQEK